MATDETQDPIRWPFIWRYAVASGFTGFALFLSTMTSQDWKWAGFAIPFALAIGVIGVMGGLVAGLFVSLAASTAARKSTVDGRRSGWAVAVVCGMSGAIALLCAVSVGAFRGVPTGWGQVLVAAGFAGVSVLIWRFGSSSRSSPVSTAGD